jgi:glycolate oxidase
LELSNDLYRALEDIVGDKNISQDQAILEGYAFQPLGGIMMGNRFLLRPAAAILPGNTKEVQAIIKFCNRTGLKFKAIGSGYGPHASAGSKEVVLLDMRRMNRIIDIDKKNMIAVIEPYVSFIQVMSETMKMGLSCNVLGSGSQVSMLASYTSMDGNNSLAVSQSYSGRNLLGIEWVLPSGEIIKVGAPGSGAGWFSGDGPGPSLRGIIRGARGAQGGLGVFTKCAAHLHPWFGPSELEISGNSPYYEGEVPQYFEYHICEFPGWQQFSEAMAKVGQNGIAFALHKTGGPGSHGHCVTGNNNEYYEKRQKGELAIPWISFSIIMAASSAAEHEWQVKTLGQILAETQGKISPMGEDPTWQKRDFVGVIKACFNPRLAFRPSGTFGVDGMVGMETTDHMAIGLTEDVKFFQKWVKTGALVNDGTLNSWAITYEGSHMALFECGYQCSALDQNSIDTHKQMTGEGFDFSYKNFHALSWDMSGEADLKRIGPLCYNYPAWMYRIKQAFDPNNASDPMMYISTKQQPRND